MLDKTEKELIIHLLNKHLEEVKKNEKMMYQPAILLAAEVKYENFVENIKKKLN